jgi:hypothetical protein
MAASKTSKVLWCALGGGLVAAAGGVLLVTGVGSGAGAALITSGLATIGSVVGGGMLAGIGVCAAGTATVSALSAAIANKVIEDPELIELAKKLKEANELFETSRKVNLKHSREIEELNKKIGDLLRDKKANAAKINELKERLIVLISRLRDAA